MEAARLLTTHPKRLYSIQQRPVRRLPSRPAPRRRPCTVRCAQAEPLSHLRRTALPRSSPDARRPPLFVRVHVFQLQNRRECRLVRSLPSRWRRSKWENPPGSTEIREERRAGLDMRYCFCAIGQRGSVMGRTSDAACPSRSSSLSPQPWLIFPPPFTPIHTWTPPNASCKLKASFARGPEQCHASHPRTFLRHPRPRDSQHDSPPPAHACLRE